MTFKFSPGDRVRIVDAGGSNHEHQWVGSEWDVSYASDDLVRLLDNGERPDGFSSDFWWSARKLALVTSDHHDLEHYKTRVRDETLLAAKRNSLCRPEVNAYLEKLGLPPWDQEYDVVLTTTVRVTADSPDEACSRAKDQMVSTRTWTVQSITNDDGGS